MLKLLALASIALIYGCASAPSMEKMQAEVAGYELPKAATADQGLVYVVRPSNAGGLVRFNVFLDDREDASEMGYNRGNQYIYFYVEPGKHTISSKAENWADLGAGRRSGVHQAGSGSRDADGAQQPGAAWRYRGPLLGQGCQFG